MCEFVRFEECSMQQTDLRNANLENHLFWGCDLRWADFRNANLTNAKIIACDIRYARFEGAIADGLRFDGSVSNAEDYTGDKKAIKVSDETTKKILLKSKADFPFSLFK